MHSLSEYKRDKKEEKWINRNNNNNNKQVCGKNAYTINLIDTFPNAASNELKNYFRRL